MVPLRIPGEVPGQPMRPYMFQPVPTRTDAAKGELLTVSLPLKR